jgi:hypothetical protein
MRHYHICVRGMRHYDICMFLLRNRLMELNPKAEHKEQALKVLKVCDQNRSCLNPLIKPLTHKLNHSLIKEQVLKVFEMCD